MLEPPGRSRGASVGARDEFFARAVRKSLPKGPVREHFDLLAGIRSVDGKYSLSTPGHHHTAAINEAMHHKKSRMVSKTGLARSSNPLQAIPKRRDEDLRKVNKKDHQHCNKVQHTHGTAVIVAELATKLVIKNEIDTDAAAAGAAAIAASAAAPGFTTVFVVLSKDAAAEAAAAAAPAAAASVSISFTSHFQKLQLIFEVVVVSKFL